MHGLEDELEPALNPTRINVVKNRNLKHVANSWQNIVMKYTTWPQILRVYGYQIHLDWVKKWPHEPGEMLANIPIPWSIWVLYVSSI